MDKVLILSKRPTGSQSYHYNLRNLFEYFVCSNIAEAILKTHNSLIDIIVIENYGESNILESITAFKHDPIAKNISIIVLCFNDDKMERIECYKCGAMDVLRAPIDGDEISAIIQNRIFVTKGYNTKKLSLGMFQLDELEFTAKFNGDNIPLTKREFDLLRYLLAHKYKVISREELIEKAWNGSEVKPRAVDTQIVRLRKKLINTNLKILAFEGRGYTLKSEDQILGS